LLIKGDIGDSFGQLDNSIDGDMILGDNNILIPVELDGTSGDIGTVGDLSRFAVCAFTRFSAEILRFPVDTISSPLVCIDKNIYYNIVYKKAFWLSKYESK